MAGTRAVVELTAFEYREESDDQSTGGTYE